MFPGLRLHGILVGEWFFDVSGGVFWPGCSLFWLLSLESDLLTLAGFSKTRASPRLSMVSSGPAASSRGRVGSLRSACGPHGPRRSHSRPACEGHNLSSRAHLVVSKSYGGFLLQRRSLATVLPDADPVFDLCFGLFLLFFLVFSQSAFVMLKCYWTICWLRC